MSNPTNVFDAGKAIVEQLTPLEPDQRARVLRWVAESLDITLHVKSQVHERTSSIQPTEADTPEPSAPASTAVGADIKTFITSRAPKSDMQFATAVAYYYRFEAPVAQRKDAIDAETLQDATRLCGVARLANPGNSLGNAAGQGYLDRAGGGQFKINTVGENLVAMAQTSPRAPNSPQARKRGRKASKQ